MPGVPGEPVVTTLVCFVFFAREAAGASSARYSLRPLFFMGRKFIHAPGASPRGNAEGCFALVTSSKAVGWARRHVRRSSKSEGGSLPTKHLRQKWWARRKRAFAHP